MNGLTKSIFHRLVVLVLLASVPACISIRPNPISSVLRDEPQASGDIWALLIAGSAGWSNYRHQADVAHSYHVLTRGGVSPDRIIVMAYDDIANNDENPFPGQIFNHPSMEHDVYEGLKIDYSRSHVNAETFLNVLAGNASGVVVGPHSSGRVIEAGPNDRIFVFYSDHGAPGVLGMPSGPFLYADQLHHVIKHRRKTNGFQEMVLYIEACESGSIFEGILEDDLEILAVTAANGRESSWGCYCPSMESPPPSEFNTCLGDLFSISWMENSDESDLNAETLKKQFQLVEERTSANFTYMQGSHVMRFGQFDIDEEPAADFLGALNDGTQGNRPWLHSILPTYTTTTTVPQRMADIIPLIHKSKHSSGVDQQQAQHQLAQEVYRRTTLDKNIASTIESLFHPTQLQSFYPTTTSSTATNNNERVAETTAVELFMTQPLSSRPENLPVVDDWDCLRGMVAVWESGCGALGDYGMQHTRTFANLCNAGVQMENFGDVVKSVCASKVDEQQPLLVAAV